MCFNMWEGLGEFIHKISEEKECSFKVVEVGVGKFFDVSDYLNKFDNLELILTDINPSKDNIFKDDIMNPNLNLYDGVDLIYSIRPPYELQPFLISLQEKIGAVLIIKPLTGEALNVKNRKMRLKTYKKTSFYIYP